MQIKMTNFAIFNYIAILNKFSFVSGELGHAIYETKRRMAKQVREFEKQRNALIEKYGVYDEEQKKYHVNPDNENFTQYAQEIALIADQEIDVEFDQVSQEVFDKTDIYNENCTILDYERLEMFFVEKTISNDEVNHEVDGL